MKKLILHYFDQFGYKMLLRCVEDYRGSDKFLMTGTDSLALYTNPSHRYVVSLRRNKSGSITGKCWKNGDA